MYLIATTLVLFCGNQNVHLKFLNQNGRQFGLHLIHVRAPITTAAVTCTYSTGLGTRYEFGGRVPRSYVPVGYGKKQNSTAQYKDNTRTSADKNNAKYERDRYYMFKTYPQERGLHQERLYGGMVEPRPHPEALPSRHPNKVLVRCKYALRNMTVRNDFYVDLCLPLVTRLAIPLVPNCKC